MTITPERLRALGRDIAPGGATSVHLQASVAAEVDEVLRAAADYIEHCQLSYDASVEEIARLETAMAKAALAQPPEPQ